MTPLATEMSGSSLLDREGIRTGFSIRTRQRWGSSKAWIARQVFSEPEECGGYFVIFLTNRPSISTSRSSSPISPDATIASYSSSVIGFVTVDMRRAPEFRLCELAADRGRRFPENTQNRRDQTGE